MGEKKFRKAIHFDLDTKTFAKFKLSSEYIYSNIKKYMEKNNFIHTQFSGYESKDKMSFYDAASFLKDMNKSFPWLPPMINKINITDISHNQNLFALIKSGQDIDATLKQATMITKSGFKATTTLMNGLNALNNKTGKFNSIKDVKAMHDNLEKYSDEEKKLVTKIVGECKRQETVEQRRQEYLGLSKNVDIEED